MTTTTIVLITTLSLCIIAYCTIKIHSRETKLTEAIYLYLHNRKVWYDYINVKTLITNHPNQNFPVYSNSYITTYDLLTTTLKDKYWICITDESTELYFGEQLILINSPLIDNLLINKLHYTQEFINKTIKVERKYIRNQHHDKINEWNQYIKQTKQQLTFTEYISTYYSKYIEQPNFMVRI